MWLQVNTERFTLVQWLRISVCLHVCVRNRLDFAKLYRTVIRITSFRLPSYI